MPLATILRGIQTTRRRWGDKGLGTAGRGGEGGNEKYRRGGIHVSTMHAHTHEQGEQNEVYGQCRPRF